MARLARAVDAANASRRGHIVGSAGAIAPADSLSLVLMPLLRHDRPKGSIESMKSCPAATRGTGLLRLPDEATRGEVDRGSWPRSFARVLYYAPDGPGSTLPPISFGISAGCSRGPTFLLRPDRRQGSPDPRESSRMIASGSACPGRSPEYAGPTGLVRPVPTFSGRRRRPRPMTGRPGPDTIGGSGDGERAAAIIGLATRGAFGCRIRRDAGRNCGWGTC